MSLKKLSIVFLIMLICFSAAICHAEEIVALSQAHAHNDYHHRRPLFDALEHGFCGVEADIYLVEGKLLVAHDRRDLTPEKTLQKLYLDPLRRQIKKNGGRVYKNGPVVTLLIDLKSEGISTYTALSKVLAQYRDILSRVENGKVTRKAVDVIISGNRPQDLIAGKSLRYAAIDGRLSDLGTDKPAHLMPLVSDNWRNHFSWRGDGPIPAAERKKLHRIVRQAHQSKRRIRLWATPEKVSVWEELYQAGADMINTDDLTGLQKYLLGKRSQ